MITFRLGLHQLDVKRAKELVDAISRTPGSCDTVWLAAMGLYPSLEKHKEYAEQWMEPAKIFRDAGLRVSLQISNTCGHGDNELGMPERGGTFALGMMNTDDDPFMVCSDGRKNKSCFCWNSTSFRQYISSVIRIYCERLHPHTLWYDDDLRASNHRPTHHGCFCDRCMEKFNAKYQVQFTREQLVYEINYGDITWRNRFISFCRQGLYDFTYEISRVGIEVTEDLSFGYEYVHEENYLGTDDDYVLKALYDVSGKPVETRPGGFYYNDKNPYLQLDKIIRISLANSLVPDYVYEKIAEIEDLPGTLYGKSISGIINEGTLDLATGCTGLSFTDVQSCHESMEYYEKIFARFSKIRPYWERLSAVSKECIPSGVCIYMGKEAHLRQLPANAPAFSWSAVLSGQQIGWYRMGIPLTYENRKPAAYLLHHAVVDHLNDEDIRFLLTQPVITDGECIKRLIQWGYGKYFAMTPEAIGFGTCEIFNDCSINGSKSGCFYEESPHAAVPMQRYIFRDLDENSTVIGRAHNQLFLSDEKCLGPCTIISEIQNDVSENKVKWAIFGYSLYNDLASSAKRNQIVNALDEICRMPVTLISEEQADIYSSVDSNGKTVAVTVFASSQNGTDSMKLIIRNPVGEKVSLMATRHNEIAELPCRKYDENSLMVTIPSLDPYEVATVFIS